MKITRLPWATSLRSCLVKKSMLKSKALSTAGVTAQVAMKNIAFPAVKNG
jgi:hypothetical protein